MKNATARTARATRPALVSPTPATLAPRPEDAPEAGHIGAVLNMTAWVPLIRYNEQCEPVDSVLCWHARMDRDSIDSDDPTDGVFVQLWATCDPLATVGQTRIATLADKSMAFTPDDFRRVVAGLNALAASLPSVPEPVV